MGSLVPINGERKGDFRIIVGECKSEIGNA
jgi:hypothetical protein